MNCSHWNSSFKSFMSSLIINSPYKCPSVHWKFADSESDERQPQRIEMRRKAGWTKLAKRLWAKIDKDLIETCRGTVSLPFDLGENGRIAVKITGDLEAESLKVVEEK